MSSASLAPSPLHAAPLPHPDQRRIAALSAAIALNVSIIVIALRPPAPPLMKAAGEAPVPTLRIIDPPKPAPPVPPLVLKPLPAPVPPAPVHIRLAAVAPPRPAPLAEGRVSVPPVAAPTLAPTAMTSIPVAPPAPIETSLGYRTAPLHFPSQAIRQHMHGTVVLRVLVNENGKPLQVVIERSSGYALLDRSARQQVLDGWLFQAAVVQGRHVPAWAQVPVNFDLKEL